MNDKITKQQFINYYLQDVFFWVLTFQKNPSRNFIDVKISNLADHNYICSLWLYFLCTVIWETLNKDEWYFHSTHLINIYHFFPKPC